MADKPLVFLEVSIGGVKINGQIKLELFDKEAPVTAANFRQLCTGGADIGHYKGSLFHRAISDYMCCGGDFIAGDGTGIGSIYGDKFPVVERSDPHRYKSHTGGLLITGHAVPAVQAPYACGPKFMITSAPAPWLADSHTIFGAVVEGLDIVKRILTEAGTPSGSMTKEVIICGCGELSSSSVGAPPPTRSAAGALLPTRSAAGAPPPRRR